MQNQSRSSQLAHGAAGAATAIALLIMSGFALDAWFVRTGEVPALWMVLVPFAAIFALGFAFRKAERFRLAARGVMVGVTVALGLLILVNMWNELVEF